MSKVIYEDEFIVEVLDENRNVVDRWANYKTLSKAQDTVAALKLIGEKRLMRIVTPVTYL